MEERNFEELVEKYLQDLWDAAMDDQIIDKFLEAFAGALDIVKPYVQEKAPHLLVT